MSQVREHPIPETIVIDVPWLKLPSSPPLVPTVGVIIAFLGLLVRCFARWLAWPDEWKYSGERINTMWAYRESLFAELGLVALVFGLALLFLAIARSPVRAI